VTQRHPEHQGIDPERRAKLRQQEEKLETRVKV